MKTIYDIQESLIKEDIPCELLERTVYIPDKKQKKFAITEDLEPNMFYYVEYGHYATNLSYPKVISTAVTSYKNYLSSKENKTNSSTQEKKSEPDEELEALKIHQNGTVEINLRTITDVRLQYNDLYIQYIEKSNIVVIGYDLTPVRVLYQFNVISKGESVKFKVRNDVGIFCSNPGLKVFDLSNMELL